MKQPTKTEQKTEQPKATEAIVAIADVVLAYRDKATPTLAEVARIADRASGLLRIADRDEKTAFANAATIQIANKYNLVN